MLPHHMWVCKFEYILCYLSLFVKFARYLAEEIHASPATRLPNVGSFADASDDDDDDDDEGSGWLTRSSPFELDPSRNNISPFDVRKHLN